jgi:hypothetical protein
MKLSLNAIGAIACAVSLAFSATGHPAYAGLAFSVLAGMCILEQSQ